MIDVFRNRGGLLTIVLDDRALARWLDKYHPHILVGLFAIGVLIGAARKEGSK